MKTFIREKMGHTTYNHPILHLVNISAYIQYWINVYWINSCTILDQCILDQLLHNIGSMYIGSTLAQYQCIYTKLDQCILDQLLSIHSQDIEQKHNFDINQGP